MADLRIGTDFTMSTITAARVESSVPVQYRLARRNGNLILQGCYQWQQGFDSSGFEWRDIPTLDLDQTVPELDS